MSVETVTEISRELSPEHQAVRDEWRERISALIARIATRDTVEED